MTGECDTNIVHLSKTFGNVSRYEQHARKCIDNVDHCLLFMKMTRAHAKIIRCFFSSGSDNKSYDMLHNFGHTICVEQFP